MFYQRSFIVAILALLMPASVAYGQDAKKRPNFLFLFADDMRADVIGALGHPDARTPNLDRLVRTGLTFRRAYIMGGDQGAVCVPSRAMMLTGKSMFTVPSQIGSATTWPIVLQRAGYRTMMTGKWHNGPMAAAASFPGARSVFFGGMSNPFAIPVADVPIDGKPRKENARIGAKHASELFADEAIAFLRQKQTKPWALYVAFTAPHDPRTPPPGWRAKFDVDKLRLPKNFLPEHPFDNGELKIRDEALEAWPRTPAAIRGHLADYLAVIAHLDEQIGRILAALEAAGELENTVILFASDNGLAIGSHGLMGKQNLYEHSIRVPLIFAGPGIPKGQTTDAFAYLLDVCPTLCELASATTPADIHGRSLVPILTGRRQAHREMLLFAYRDFQRGIRDDRHVALWYPKIDRWQLFDLRDDPDQIHDLSAIPAHAETLRSLRARLTTLRQEFGDNQNIP